VDESIRLWDVATGGLIATLHDGVGWVKTLAFSPDGRRIAFGGRNGTVQFRELTLEGKLAQPNRS
jgi:WD40 repeat protein